VKLIRIASKMKKYLAKCASKVSVWGCTLSHRIMIIINCCFFFYKHLSFSSLLPCKASWCLSPAAPQRFSAQVYLLIYDNCDKCRDLVHGGNYAFLSGYTKIIFLLISQLLTKINFAMKKRRICGHMLYFAGRNWRLRLLTSVNAGAHIRGTCRRGGNEKSMV